MATKIKNNKKEKTKYPCIYHNPSTGKYDVKYNYTVYNPLTARNEYKQKWIYNISSLSEARQELDRLRTEKTKKYDKDVTLEGVLNLWEKEALTQDFSPTTIRTTRSNMRMIYQFLSSDTKVKNITKQMYYDLIAALKEKYKPETVHTLNGTFRKMIALSVREELITDNILLRSRNIRTMHTKEYRVISYKEFEIIRDYFSTHTFINHGKNYAPMYQFFYTLLYYTGMRIGEATALKYADIEEFSYYQSANNISVKNNAISNGSVMDFESEPPEPSPEPTLDIYPTTDQIDETTPLPLNTSSQINPFTPTDPPGNIRITGRKVNVTKTYLEGEHKVKNTTKNYKNRSIPLHNEPEKMYLPLLEKHLQQPDASKNDRIFCLTHATYNRVLRKACAESGLPNYHCHEFRHTFISNMIRENVPLTVIEKVSGDVIGTIIKRYAHMFESDEVKVLNALSRVQKNG